MPAFFRKWTGWWVGCVLGLWGGVWGMAADLRPPGYRPASPGLHLLQGGRVVVRPGESGRALSILVRDGVIAAVGEGLEAPVGAQVWVLTNRTIYAGFIDLGVTVRTSPVPRGVITKATDFYGAGNRVRAGGAGVENGRVMPHRRVGESYEFEGKELEALRETGFTVGNALPAGGIVRGWSAVVALSDRHPNERVLEGEGFQVIGLSPEGGPEATYPVSLMGVIALVRQTLMDAQHHWAERERGGGMGSGFDPGLEALGAVMKGRRSVLFEPGSVLVADRAGRLASELGVRAVQLSSGQEWRRPDLLRGMGTPFVVPLNFPQVPSMPSEDDWEQVTLDQLRAWDWGPENAAVLRREGVEIALTTRGLSDKKHFRERLRLAMDRGLGEADALAALTTVPARLAGLEARLGTIEEGKLANFTVVEGEGYFRPTNRVTAVWIQGEPYVFPTVPGRGVGRTNEVAAVEKPSVGASGADEGKRALLKQRQARSPLEGRGPLAAPRSVVVRGATVWTSGPEGRLEGADVWFEAGKVRAVGRGLAVPAEAHVIEGKGLHVTPGLIDCHSHSMVLGGVNESGLPSAAMVRVGDVVNSETRNLMDQLAGGLTVANLLHGSANPIGGQNCVIKLRDGASPEGLKFEGAPAGIKFALGENVKQANAGERYVTRYPQSRLGVVAFLDNRFQAAVDYLAARKAAGGERVRRDLEMEALGEILEGRRWIHCHSYRQDEILAFLRLMEGYGVRVGTLQHVLEGYKVADEIAVHGAGASCFADWWAYKYEVIDAIPHAGALMHERGVLVSFNSDSSDLARRLNLEAAKAVKYGGVDEVEALRFVTLNPARQLRIDGQVGSLEPGKDADFVVWSGSPLDTRSVCLETWIEGRKYFDRAAAAARAAERERERTELLAKARKASGGTAGGKGEGEGGVAGFFRTVLELKYEGHLRHCDED